MNSIKMWPQILKFLTSAIIIATIISHVQARETSERHNEHFGKNCPTGFFACNNGECLSPKWQCDGHYDCDDFSDETNCAMDDKVEPIRAPNRLLLPTPMPEPSSTTSGSQSRQQHNSNQPSRVTPPKEEISEPKFNSTLEPLMLVSTGDSIRAYWMSSRVYFDVFSIQSRAAQHRIVQHTSPSITEALSIFFGMFDPDRLTGSSSSSSSGFSIPGLSSSGVRAAPKSGSSSSSKNGSTPVANVESKGTIVGVDMDPENKEVFWVELGKDAGVYSTTIEHEFDLRSRRQLRGHKTIVEFGLLSPEDVALDTVAKNLYITDAGLQAIVVCSVKHSDCKIIVKNGPHKPRAIIVDSSTGWLIYSDWGDHPGIFLVAMDGKERETLIDSDVVWPNGLASDYSTNHLYWADARLSKIERVDLVTRKRRVIIKESVANPFSLSIFENRLYWSDWSGNNIKSCDKSTGNTTKVIMHAENIYGIHIYHPSIYAKSQVVLEHQNPCWSKKCSHLCLLRPSTSDSTLASFANREAGQLEAVCACPESMTLGDGIESSTCFPAELSFVLLSSRDYIAQMFPEHIGIGTIDRILYSTGNIIHDVAPDWHNDRLFFFDAAKNFIFKLTIPGLEPAKPGNVEKFIASGSSTGSMVFDSLSENLYWLETGNGTLVMCSTITKFKAILKRHLDHPTSMVLDPIHRVFYIATSEHIMRTNIHGDDLHDLVIANDIGQPVSLHLDLEVQRLFWADSHHETIESIDLDIKRADGIKPMSRALHRHHVGDISALTVYRNDLIWTVQNGEYLFKAPMDRDDDARSGLVMGASEHRPIVYKLPSGQSASRGSVSDITRLLVVNPVIIDGSICRNETCPYACAVDAGRKRVCLCPDLETGGYVIGNSTDGTCPPPTITKTHAVIVVPNNAHRTSVVNPRIPQHPTPEAEPPEHDDFLNIAPDHLVHHPQTADFNAHVDEQLKHGHEHEHEALRASPTSSSIDEAKKGGVVWPIVLLLLLSITALVSLISLLILYKQGRLPRQVSALSVSFIPQSHDKDGAMLLLDSDA